MIQAVLFSALIALACLDAAPVFAAGTCEVTDAARIYTTSSPDRLLIELDFGSAEQIGTLLNIYGDLPAHRLSNDAGWTTEGRDIRCNIEPCGEPGEKASTQVCRMEIDREGKAYRPATELLDETVSKRVGRKGGAEARLGSPVEELGRHGLNLWVGVGWDAANTLHDFLKAKTPIEGNPDHEIKGLVLTCGRGTEEPAFCTFHVNLKGEVSL